MLPDFEQWVNDKGVDLDSKSKEEVMGQKLEDTAKEAIVALETLKKHLDRLEEERTLYTAALVGMHGNLSKERPDDGLRKAAEDAFQVLDGVRTDHIDVKFALRAALDKVKS